MHQNGVNIPRFAQAQSLPRSDHKQLDLQPDVILNSGEQNIRQAGIVKTGCDSQFEALSVGLSSNEDQQSR